PRSRSARCRWRRSGAPNARWRRARGRPGARRYRSLILLCCESLDHVAGNCLRLEPARILWIAADPNPRLEPLDGRLPTVEDLVGHVEARPAKLADGRLGDDVVAILCRGEELRPRLDHGIAAELIRLQHLVLGHAGGALEQRRDARLEHLEIARVE